VRVRTEEAGGRLWVERICFSFQRARSRVEPAPSLGVIPVNQTARFPGACARGWPRTAFLIHIHEGEVMWIGLGASTAGSAAIRVRLDGLDAITGEPWQPRLVGSPPNYIVWPAQPWIEGIYRDGWLQSGFSLESASSLRLELSVYGPRSRQGARVESAGAHERPLVLHELSGLTGERALAGIVMPDRTGLRWTATDGDGHSLCRRSIDLQGCHGIRALGPSRRAGEVPRRMAAVGVAGTA
jgi:hypothetical protein